MESGEVIFSGYLFKSPPESKLRNLRSLLKIFKGGKGKSCQPSFWTKRFFVLHKNKLLYYYKSDKDRKPVKDPIQLTWCKCVESNLDHEKFKYLFSIVTDKRTYYLVAETQQDMEIWVEKLCIVCGFIRTDHGTMDQGQSLESRRPVKPNEYSISHAHPRPIANKSRTMSPVGTPSSFSSSGSSLTSPTGPCPLSIPRHVIDGQNKSRSLSDPPEASLDPLVVPRGTVRRQSEQIGSSTLPGHVHGVHNKARLSGNLLEAFNAEPRRPLSGDAYDNLPSPKKVVGHSVSTPAVDSDSHQENYDNVPIPRALSPVTSPLSPRPPSGHHLSPDKYDKLPTPRPVSQGSNRSSQDVYDLVPPPRPMSSCSQSDQGLYDVPPIGRMDNEENYDVVPPPRPMSSSSQEDQGLYDIPPRGKIGDQDNYDFVPPPRPTSSCSDDGQALYDVPPIAKSPEQENYDFVPLVSRPVAPKPSHLQAGRSQQNYDVLPVRQSIYDVPPVFRSQEEENYDIVPPSRPVAPKPNHIHPGTAQENYDSLPLQWTSQPVCNGQSTMDELLNGRVSDQENYDHVPLIHRPVAPKSNHVQQRLSQENYDVVPIRQNSPKVSQSPSVYDNLTSERSSTQENYDIVPCLNRPVSTLSSPTQPRTSQDIYDIVPIPRPSDDNYDIVPPPRAISTSYQPGNSSSIQSNGLGEHNQRFSDIYSVPPKLQSSDSSEHVPPPNTPYRPGKDAYDPLPSTNRPVSADSGLNASSSSICSLKSDGDYGQEDRYDAPLPALPTQSRDSGSLSDEDREPSDIYDVPPNWGSNNNALPMTSDEIYDVPPNHNQVSPSESVASPVVDRSTKPPPMVNRAAKPKTGKENHSYCNMPPKVDRELKYKSGAVAPPEHNYMNYGFHPPQRPQHLPLVKTLPGNHYVGAFPNQTDRWSSGPLDDADYLPMQPPTRSETTRCYSFTKEEKPGSRAVDQCYEDMSALQTRRYSGGKSSSSSTSSLADNDDLYMAMAPSQMEQRQRRDLLYAEVEIVDGANHVAPVPSPSRRENTQYTYINEESTRALLQTSHAWHGNR